MKKKIKLLIGLIVFMVLITSSLSTGTYIDNDKKGIKTNPLIDTSYRIQINIPNAEKVATTLRSEGFDVLRGTITSTSLEIIVHNSEFNTLRDLGYHPIILEESRPFREIQAERIQNRLDVVQLFLKNPLYNFLR